MVVFEQAEFQANKELLRHLVQGPLGVLGKLVSRDNRSATIEALRRSGLAGEPHNIDDINKLLINGLNIFINPEFKPFINALPAELQANIAASQRLLMDEKAQFYFAKMFLAYASLREENDQVGLLQNIVTEFFHSGPQPASALQEYLRDNISRQQWLRFGIEFARNNNFPLARFAQEFRQDVRDAGYQDGPEDYPEGPEAHGRLPDGPAPTGHLNDAFYINDYFSRNPVLNWSTRPTAFLALGQEFSNEQMRCIIAGLVRNGKVNDNGELILFQSSRNVRRGHEVPVQRDVANAFFVKDPGKHLEITVAKVADCKPARSALHR